MDGKELVIRRFTKESPQSEFCVFCYQTGRKKNQRGFTNSCQEISSTHIKYGQTTVSLHKQSRKLYAQIRMVVVSLYHFCSVSIQHIWPLINVHKIPYDTIIKYTKLLNEYVKRKFFDQLPNTLALVFDGGKYGSTVMSQCLHHFIQLMI